MDPRGFRPRLLTPDPPTDFLVTFPWPLEHSPLCLTASFRTSNLRCRLGTGEPSAAAVEGPAAAAHRFLRRGPTLADSSPEVVPAWSCSCRGAGPGGIQYSWRPPPPTSVYEGDSFQDHLPRAPPNALQAVLKGPVEESEEKRSGSQDLRDLRACVDSCPLVIAPAARSPSTVENCSCSPSAPRDAASGHSWANSLSTSDMLDTSQACSLRCHWVLGRGHLLFTACVPSSSSCPNQVSSLILPLCVLFPLSCKPCAIIIFLLRACL